MPFEIPFGGGGVTQKPTLYEFNQVISSGVTGDILTLTAPPGQFVKLTYLSCEAGNSQAGVSVIADGDTVVDQKILSRESAAQANFGVGNSVTTSTVSIVSASPFMVDVTAKQIVINKNAGNTAVGILYCYMYFKLI